MEGGKYDPNQQQPLQHPPNQAGQLPGQSVGDLPYPAQPPPYDTSQNMHQGIPLIISMFWLAESELTNLYYERTAAKI